MRPALPYLSIAVYCVCTAVAAVWISFSFSGLSGYAITLFSFVVSFVVFTGIQQALHGDVFRLTRQYPAKVLVLNVFTLTSWLFAFMALYHVEPSIECAVFQGFLPIAVLAADLTVGRVALRSARTLGIGMIAASLFGLLLMRFLEGRGVMQFGQEELWAGVLLASVAGISAGLHAFFSADLYRQAECTTLEILCNRFFLLLIVTGVLGGPDLMRVFAIAPVTILHLAVLSAVSVLIPIFTLQYSVQTLGAAPVSIITPTVPVIALSLEQLLRGWPSVLIPALIACVCASIALTNYLIHRTSSHRRRADRLMPDLRGSRAT